MTDDSASSFSFTNPAAPAGGSQAGTSPSIETDGGTVTGTASGSVKRSTPRKMIEPRGIAGSASQAVMDVDRTSGKSKSDTPPTTPKKMPRRDISPMPSRVSSPMQSIPFSEAYASPMGVGGYPSGPTGEPEETSMLNEEITQLRKALYNSEDSVRREELRCLNIWRTSEENAMKIEIAAHDEFVIMNARLGAMTTELQESRQEDEGSTYRIEELERFRDLSEEFAAYINMRYQDLRTEHNEQMTYAQSLIGNIGSSAAGTTDDLRSQLQHAHNRLTYEIENVARLENLTQYEANMSLLENENVSHLHVELQEHRSSNFRARTEIERNVLRLEEEIARVNSQRDSVILELNEVSQRLNVRVFETNYELEPCQHELSLEHANVRSLNQRCRGLEIQCQELERG